MIGSAYFYVGDLIEFSRYSLIAASTVNGCYIVLQQGILQIAEEFGFD
jgi:hypothetical protein